jgi:DNA primase catalytic subunit
MTNHDTYKRRGLSQSKGSSIKRKVQLGSSSDLKKWADRIGPRSVAAAAPYRKEPEAKRQK